MAHAGRDRAAQSTRRRSRRQRARHPSGGGRRPPGPGPRSSSRPSSPCADIRPRTSSCAPPSSTPARASSPRWRPQHRRRNGHRRLPRAAGRRVPTTPRRCCATAPCGTCIASTSLPNFTVFDEERYFEARRRSRACSTSTAWASASSSARTCGAPSRRPQARAAGAQVLVVPNGSPYHTEQQRAAARAGGRARARMRRTARVRQSRRRAGRARVRRRVVRGRRDGCARPAGSRVARGGRARRIRRQRRRGTSAARSTRRSTPHVYQALVMGVRDYVDKNGFPGALVGVSGGVDSALTLAIAVDALGRDRVRAVMLPSPYNAAMSLEDAREMAALDGVRYDEIPIDGIAGAFGSALAREFAGLPPTRRKRTSRRASAARSSWHCPTSTARSCSPPATSPRWPWATRRSTATWRAASRC